MISKFRLYFLGFLTLQCSYAQALTVSYENASYLHGAASYMTEPVCQIHQIYRELSLVDELYPSHSLFDSMSNVAYKGYLIAKLATYGLASVVTTVPGILLRP